MADIDYPGSIEDEEIPEEGNLPDIRPIDGCRSPISCIISMPETSEASRDQFQELLDQGKLKKIASYGFVKISTGATNWTNLPCDDYDTACAEPLLDEIIGPPPGPLVGKTYLIPNMWFVSGQSRWVKQTYEFPCNPATYIYYPPHQEFPYTSRWTTTKYSYAAVDVYTECDYIPDGCPECYTMDEFGWCEYDESLPGCSYDSDNGCTPYRCINVSGPSNIECNKTYEYTVQMVGLISDCSFPYQSDYVVYLSYVGSTVSHNGPATITIRAGTTSASFVIRIPDSEIGILRIASDTVNGIECTPIEANVYCGDNVPYNVDARISEPDTSIFDTCCDYVPKDFITWSYGLNMQVLVPPNKR